MLLLQLQLCSDIRIISSKIGHIDSKETSDLVLIYSLLYSYHIKHYHWFVVIETSHSFFSNHTPISSANLCINIIWSMHESNFKTG